MVQFVGIIRFSVLSTEQKYFRAALAKTFDEYAEEILSQERLKERFAFFEGVTLPSLESQSRRDFIAFVIAPRLLPDVWKIRLGQIAASYPFLRVIYADERGFVTSQCSPEILSVVEENLPFATFRLDDDDGLSSDFIARLARFTKGRFSGMAISFCRGFILESGNNGMFGIEVINKKNISAGLALIGDPRFKKTIFDFSDYHLGLHKKLPVITDGRKPSFVMSTHESNDSGGRRRAQTISMTPAEAEAALAAEGIAVRLWERIND